MPPAVPAQAVTLQRSDVVGSTQIRREHCRVTQTLLDDLGRQAGEQIRLFLPSLTVTATSQSALYTADLYTDAENPGTILMDDLAIWKINDATAIAAGATLSAGAFGLAPSCTDGTFLFGEASASKSFVERHTVVGESTPQLLVIAPHGGNVDQLTASQADSALATLGSLGKCALGWICEGKWGSNQTFNRWHITTDDLQPASFPALAELLACTPAYQPGVAFRYVVAFHGNGGPGPSVIVGGRAELAARQAVHDALVAALAGTGTRVCVAGPLADTGGADCSGLDVGSLGASSSTNLINRLSPNDGTVAGQGGIQIEQSLDVRTSHGTEVAGAVATALAGLLV
jgi:hypothetical protein